MPDKEMENKKLFWSTKRFGSYLINRNRIVFAHTFFVSTLSFGTHPFSRKQAKGSLWINLYVFQFKFYTKVNLTQQFRRHSFKRTTTITLLNSDPCESLCKKCVQSTHTHHLRVLWRWSLSDIKTRECNMVVVIVGYV